jgi:hypothetical protein
MTDNPLKSLANYSHFVAELLHRPTVERSTVAVWSDSQYTGIAEGEVFFSNGIRLRLREELDFDASLIASCGYKVIGAQNDCTGTTTFPIPTTQIWPQHSPTTSTCPLTLNTIASRRQR